MPVGIGAWRSAVPAPSMNEASIKLRNYCAGAGLFPSSSERRNFNDITAMNALEDSVGSGGYTLTQVQNAGPL